MPDVKELYDEVMGRMEHTRATVVLHHDQASMTLLGRVRRLSNDGSAMYRARVDLKRVGHLDLAVVTGLATKLVRQHAGENHVFESWKAVAGESLHSEMTTLDVNITCRGLDGLDGLSVIVNGELDDE